MNNAINKEQNKPEYLRYRYVSRKLYSSEKKYRTLIIVVGIIIYILGLIPKVSDLHLVLFLPVIWIPVGEFLKIKLSTTHNKAVNYHEYNDREMFELSQLSKLIDNHNFLYQEAIAITESKKDKEYFEDMIKKEHKISIKNWYNNFKGMPFEISVIMAQDENITWEKNQRKIYKFTLIIVLLAILIISCSTIYYITNDIVNIVYAIPIIWDVIKIIIDNKEAISRCDDIKDKIGEVYFNLKHNKQNYDIFLIKDKATEIQFKIYENRKDSIPVPDIIYYINRNKLQKDSNLYIKSIKSDIKTYIR